MPQQTNHYFSTTLEKGLRILSLFSEQRPTLTQTAISHTLDLNMTSTYRFVNTLVQLGYLRKNNKTKELRLGIRAMALGCNFLRSFDALEVIRTHVDQIHDEHNITVDVALVVDDVMMTVHRKEAEETLNYRLPSVNRAWHATSLGKAYLAFLPPDELKKTINRLKLEAKTDKTIVRKKDLYQEIAKTRRRGYSRCDEEFMPGLITVGAPLINQGADRAIGAVSFDFSIVQHSLSRIERQYVEPIMKLARSISEVISLT